MMSLNDFFTKLLQSFERYYTINKENPIKPFSAEADFISHSERYVLVKSAKIAEIDSNEFVYFYVQDEIDLNFVKELSSIAWKNGLEKVHPSSGHRNSDITLIIAVDKINLDNSDGQMNDSKYYALLKKSIKKIKFSKNYMLGLYGFSNFKLAIYENKSKKTFSNFYGRDYSKLFDKIGL